MNLTYEQFKKIFPNISETVEWFKAISEVLPQYEINTPVRLAAFLSQCSVETGGWKKFEENMNYSAERMMKVWPRIFNEQLARECDHNGPMVANHAYANRMGNGPYESGDGWAFRGRGPLHLTGRDNYTAFGRETNGSLDAILKIPQILITNKVLSIQSACWFWRKNKLNEVADTQDITKLTKKINGGSNGLDERKALFTVMLNILK